MAFPFVIRRKFRTRYGESSVLDLSEHMSYHLHMGRYIERISDKQLEKLLRLSGAVLVTGVKWCGKTTSSRRYAESEIILDNSSEGKDLILRANAMPSDVLDQEPPLLIDEWQNAPRLWDAVRREVDNRGKRGQFILTGSSTPLGDEAKQEIFHSGFGRIANLRMHTMSSAETGFSYGKVSLSSLFEDGSMYISDRSDRTLEDMALALCRGGWPNALDDEDDDALEIPYMLLDELINIDVQQRIEELGLRKNPSDVRRLLRSYSRNTATQASKSLIRRDLSSNEDVLFNEDTLNKYLALLETMFITEDLEAWAPSVRLKTRVQGSPTRHLSEPSLAVASLGMSPQALLKDFRTFGFLFESYAIRDLRVYSAALNGKLYHYRDSKGLEADAVMELRDQRWAMFEVKLFDPARVDEGAVNLLKIKEKMDYTTMKQPSFLMVITAGKYARLRPDGVYEVPISLLAP